MLKSGITVCRAKIIIMLTTNKPVFPALIFHFNEKIKNRPGLPRAGDFDASPEFPILVTF
jgi:hypothetical protein